MGNINLTDIEPVVQGSPFEHFARIDNLYVASKLSSEDQIKYLQEKGIKIAIDMKERGETDFPDEEALKKAGIRYHHFPVSDINDLDFDTLSELSRILNKDRGAKLLYCMSGNRVGAALALQQSLVCGHPKQRAFDAACKIGLTKEELKEKVLKIFGR